MAPTRDVERLRMVVRVRSYSHSLSCSLDSQQMAQAGRRGPAAGWPGAQGNGPHGLLRIAPLQHPAVTATETPGPRPGLDLNFHKYKPLPFKGNGYRVLRWGCAAVASWHPARQQHSFGDRPASPRRARTPSASQRCLSGGLSVPDLDWFAGMAVLQWPGHILRPSVACLLSAPFSGSDRWS